MTTVDRPEPGLTDAERPMLEGWLDHHRATLAIKCAGLDDTQLREASVPPSGFTLLGLVRHLTDVERHWFRRGMAGEDAPPRYYSDEDLDGDFRVGEGDTWADTYAAWQEEIGAARAITAGHALDDLSALPARSGSPYSLRWVLTHMIEEYARHNGHADLLRERIDGATGV